MVQLQAIRFLILDNYVLFRKTIILYAQCKKQLWINDFKTLFFLIQFRDIFALSIYCHLIKMLACIFKITISIHSHNLLSFQTNSLTKFLYLLKISLSLTMYGVSLYHLYALICSVKTFEDNVYNIVLHGSRLVIKYLHGDVMFTIL